MVKVLRTKTMFGVSHSIVLEPIEGYNNGNPITYNQSADGTLWWGPWWCSMVFWYAKLFNKIEDDIEGNKEWEEFEAWRG